MGIRIVLRRRWIGLGCLALSLIGAVPGAVQAQLQLPQPPAVNAQCVTATLLQGNTQAVGTLQPTCGGNWYGHGWGLIVTGLQDGSVLAASGWVGGTHTGTYTRTAEIYNPQLGTFLPVLPMANTVNPPWFTRAVLLGNGQVLIVLESTSGPDESEVYVPNLLGFLQVGSASTKPTLYFSLTAFGTSNALVAGGEVYGPGTALASALVYNAYSLSYAATGSLNQARISHSAVALADGKILVVGGYPGYDAHGNILYALASAEVYDPATGKFTRTGNMTAARINPFVIGLRDGRALIVGGCDVAFVTSGGYTYQDCQPLNSAEVYDPVSGRFSATGSLVRPLWDHGSLTQLNEPLLMKNGKVLLGDEIYDPATGSFSLAPGLSSLEMSGVYGAARALLPSGQVLQVPGSYLYQPPR